MRFPEGGLYSACMWRSAGATETNWAEGRKRREEARGAKEMRRRDGPSQAERERKGRLSLSSWRNREKLWIFFKRFKQGFEGFERVCKDLRFDNGIGCHQKIQSKTKHRSKHNKMHMVNFDARYFDKLFLKGCLR